MMNSIFNHVRFYRTKKQWRKLNSHNETFMGNLFDVKSVEVGRYTYGLLNVINHNVNEKLVIGSFCSIAPDVTFILNGEHYLSLISTFPFKAHCLHSVKYEASSKGNIIVDDDVWIGTRAIIMSGVHIHQGAVIAAGAVVCKDVMPYEIVGGVPAKRIKMRFNEEFVEELMKVDFHKFDNHLIQEHINELYEEIKDKDQLSWLPKKNDTDEREKMEKD